MAAAERSGRANQRKRTRKDLLQAASRLLKGGRTPTLEEIAEAAMVSRATAYRYFPSLEALLAEAAVDVAMPDPGAFFQDDPSPDPVTRLQRLDTALYDTILANEPLLRTMLSYAVRQDSQADRSGKVPRRQDRRTPLIEAALEPAHDQFDSSTRTLLTKALALIMGPEAMIVAKDVLRLDEAAGRKVKSWAIRALVEAAKKPQAHN